MLNMVREGQILEPMRVNEKRNNFFDYLSNRECDDTACCGPDATNEPVNDSEEEKK